MASLSSRRTRFFQNVPVSRFQECENKSCTTSWDLGSRINSVSPPPHSTGPSKPEFKGGERCHSLVGGALKYWGWVFKAIHFISPGPSTRLISLGWYIVQIKSEFTTFGNSVWHISWITSSGSIPLAGSPRVSSCHDIPNSSIWSRGEGTMSGSQLVSTNYLPA